MFLCPRIGDSGGILFFTCPSVCPSVRLFVRKNFNLGHNFWLVRAKSLILDMCIPCDHLSDDIIIFDLVILTLAQETFYENFNLGHNFWLVGARPFILDMCILCDETFHIRSWSLTLWNWPCWSLSMFVHQKFNLGHNFSLVSTKSLILDMCIPCDETFQMTSWYLTLWPWPWRR